MQYCYCTGGMQYCYCMLYYTGGMQYCYYILYCHWRHAVLLMRSNRHSSVFTRSTALVSFGGRHETISVTVSANVLSLEAYSIVTAYCIGAGGM